MAMVLNFVLFQMGWFACVLGAAHGLAWAGALTALAIVAWHVVRAGDWQRELLLVACAVALGIVFESLLVQSGWVRFGAGVVIEGAATYWMVALWALFATTLNVSLRGLRAHGWLAALLGAIGGPLAYYAGARLGALELVATGAGLAAIGAGWAVLTPLLFRAALRLDGYGAARVAS
ncbi:MAG: DUF2878 domain-containing protein [Betaproteobacteria bacterium]|nr:DUF2878 domain-containing protein [Betaproteobacteria bacterium]MDH4325407.1 DUF2878 domain-containing protein [Betaproteobacteria bacterium]MDH5211600.1 DUF2878 domain-containing protein [Betaproteobacteria bacterium]MDH5579149.1 DUF2878 domain-containing protein [Betaproteobacteria bacterium]